MNGRLLDRLEPRRRHLTFLVGVLVLTFLLTGWLTYQAYRTDADVREMAEQRVVDAVERAAVRWREVFEPLLSEEIQSLALRIEQNRDAAPADLLRLLAAERICALCPDTVQVLAVFSNDGTLLYNSGGPVPPSAVVAGLWAAPGNRSDHRITWAIAARLHFLRAEDRAHPVLALETTDASGRLQRGYALVLGTDVLEYMLRHAFRAKPLALELRDAPPNEALFAPSASADDVPLFTESPRSPFSARSEGNGALVSGLDLLVNVRPDAIQLLRGPVGPSRMPLLLFVLAVVGGLIVLALLLVRKEAEIARLRSEFISGVSHELRTPLAQIRMFTETLLLGRVRSDLERRRSLEIIDQEARRLTNLVENVLAFSRAEGGRSPRLVPEPTLFAAEVAAAVESFGPMCRARGAEIRVEVQENSAAPVDRNALRQILVNLIDNGLKYGPAGQRLTVGVALFGDAARLWVDDEGPGIPAPERERVFDSFFRLPRDVTARAAGSGIGLAVVRELAALHGGRVWVEAAPGGGARFLVEFPDGYLLTLPRSTGLSAAS